MNGLVRRAMAWWRARLARRIVLPAVAVTLLFVAALGFVAFRLGQRAVIDQVDARNRQLAGQLGSEVALFFQTQIDTLRLLGAELLENPDPAARRAALLRLRARFPYNFNDLHLYNAQGRELFAASGPLGDLLTNGPQEPIDSADADPEALRALSERTLIVSPVDFRPISGTPFVTATLPLARCPADTSCAPQAALLAQIDLRSFWTRVDSFRIAEGAVIIVDSDGRVLAHPDRRRVGDQLDQVAIQPLLEGNEGTTRYDQDGRMYLAAYAPVGSPLGWGVVVEQERNTALQLVGTIGLATSLATLLSAISLATLLTNLIGRSIRPLTALSQATERIAASGDLSEDVAATLPLSSTSAEIVGLAVGFDGMIAKLRAAQDELQGWNDELERRVNERTAQLQTLIEVARQSSGSLERQTVLQIVLNQIGRLVHYDAAAVRLLDATETRLETVAAIGMRAAMMPRRMDLANAGMLVTVMTGREPLIVPDTTADAVWRATFGPDMEAGSWLGVPLLAQERPIGVLTVYSATPDSYGDEDAALLAALGAQVAIALSHASLYEESVRRVERELQVARQIQQHLFPERAPALAGLDIATFYRPARETTGDFYAFVAPRSSDNGRLAPAECIDLFIGDVSGKSLPAALLMAMARTALYAAASGAVGDPAQTMRQANAVLYGDMPRGSFVASTYASFDPASGGCRLVNAAQPAPLLVRDGVATLLEGQGDHLPLGVLDAPVYQSVHVPLLPGDLLVFYTDGVIEAFGPDRELFGFERLQAVVAAGAPGAAALVERVISAVADWLGPAPQGDDIALLVVHVTAAWPGRGPAG